MDQLYSGMHEHSKDYKTELQEFSQKKYEALPVYQLVGEAGPDHCKEFEVELRIKGKLYGQGRGRSKKEAEQQAAKFALGQLKKTNEKSS
jgi:ribonuclease-3